MIELFEYEPTRSQKCRWALREADLEYESIGNEPGIFGTHTLAEIHPLNKLPAVRIDGQGLFESSAIVAAIGERARDKQLIGLAGSWARSLYDQWTAYALTELEPWAWSSMLHTWDIFLPEEERIPSIVEPNRRQFLRGVGGLESHLRDSEYLIEGRFSMADINVGYALNLGRGLGFLGEGCEVSNAYLDRLHARPHCALTKP